MIDESAAVLPIYMLFSAAFGFMVGDALGQNFGRRKCLEEANEELREELETARAGEAQVRGELERQRGLLYDIHKHVLAVSKGLEKHPS